MNNYSEDKVDAVIVIGTQLETAMAHWLVVNALWKDILTLEFNMETCMFGGHVKQVIGKSEETLPEFLSAFQSAFAESQTQASSKL